MRRRNSSGPSELVRSDPAPPVSGGAFFGQGGAAGARPPPLHSAARREAGSSPRPFKKVQTTDADLIRVMVTSRPPGYRARPCVRGPSGCGSEPRCPWSSWRCPACLARARLRSSLRAMSSSLSRLSSRSANPGLFANSAGAMILPLPRARPLHDVAIGSRVFDPGPEVSSNAVSLYIRAVSRPSQPCDTRHGRGRASSSGLRSPVAGLRQAIQPAGYSAMTSSTSSGVSRATVHSACSAARAAGRLVERRPKGVASGHQLPARGQVGQARARAEGFPRRDCRGAVSPRGKNSW